MKNEDLYPELVKIDKRLSNIEIDLRHHIKRSDKHERWLMVMIVGAAMTAGAGLKYVAPLVMKFLI